MLRALIESGEYSFTPGRWSMLTGIRRVVEGESPNIQACIGRRSHTYGDVSWTTSKAPNPRTQQVNVRANARYHRFQICVDGNYDRIVGSEPSLKVTGRT